MTSLALMVERLKRLEAALEKIGSEIRACGSANVDAAQAGPMGKMEQYGIIQKRLGVQRAEIVQRMDVLLDGLDQDYPGWDSN